MKAQLLNILTKELITKGEFEYDGGPFQGTLVADTADPTMSGRSFILMLEDGKRGKVRLYLHNIFTAEPPEVDPHTFNVELLGEGWQR